MTHLDETHDPARTSWVESANGHRDFPVQNLPLGVFSVSNAEPRIGVLECSRRLRVARGTVQARLDRLAERGVIRGNGPDIDPVALGYGVTAFVTLEIRQRFIIDPDSVARIDFYDDRSPLQVVKRLNLLTGPFLIGVGSRHFNRFLKAE